MLVALAVWAVVVVNFDRDGHDKITESRFDNASQCQTVLNAAIAVDPADIAFLQSQGILLRCMVVPSAPETPMRRLPEATPHPFPLKDWL